MIGWHKSLTLQDYPVRAKTTNRVTEKSKSAWCTGKCFQLYYSIEVTGEFKDVHGNKYDSCKGILSWNTDFNV